ncbi:MAG TPA: hypothetical protein VF753_03295 [Terriglobales bacterium]
MEVQRSVIGPCCLLWFAAIYAGAAFALPNDDKYLCTEPNPESICSSVNTCGSTSVPCTVEIKRTDGVSVTPSIPNFKSNDAFCVKRGTSVVWKSGSKDTGFLVDFGPSPPYTAAGAIIGGSDRSRSVVLTKQGCYKFSAGACISGAISGMCASVDSKLVVTNGK